MLDMVFGIIGTLLYPLFSIIFVLIDTLQAIFRALAGVGNVHVGSAIATGVGDTTGAYGSVPIGSANTGDPMDTGLIFFLLNTPLVKNLLMSITILALFLLILFTVMAFIKNVYTTKPKSWQEIIGNSLKGLMSFVFIPVCCLLGVWVSNIVLKAIDGATSTGGSTQMSRKLFICCAYNANSYRLGTVSGEETAKSVWEQAYGEGTWDAVKEIPEGRTEADYYAELVDTAYADGDATWSLNIYNQWGVADGYAVYQINYLLMVVGGIFMLYVLVSLAYAMVRRMFILVMLFVISPAICAMYPLDEGSAVGSWRKNFISTTIGAYGAVAGMNIFFSLMPIVDNINFLGSYFLGDTIVDSIVQLLIMTCGLFVVKEGISMISGFIGGDDAYSKGASLRSSTKNAIKKNVGGTIGVFTKAAGNKAAGGSFFGSLFKQAGDATLKDMGIDRKQIQKTYEDSKKSTFEERKERHDRQEAETRRHQAREELGLRTGWDHNVDGWVKGTKWIGRGLGAVGRAVKGEFGFIGGDGNIDEEKMFELLDKYKNDPKMQKTIMEEAARAQTRKNGSSAAGWHGMNPFNAEEVVTVEDLEKKYNARNDRIALVERNTRLNDTRLAAETEFTTYRDANKNTLFVDGDEAKGMNTKYTKAEIEELKVKAMNTDTASATVDGSKFEARFGTGTTYADAYTQAVRTNEVFEEYEEKEKAYKNAAKTLADALESSAEKFKGEMKGAALELANTIKSALESDLGGTEMANTIAAAMKQAYTEASNKSASDPKKYKDLLDLLKKLGADKIT